ncbi:MAG: LysR family transcriptional regulator [Lachnospiraceae bacterium]|jgi:DNA-binding transcriptional LysR family regulator|nr:LysR family transcriptional regulator [Lachnospiraceae bacterium]
MKMSDWLLLQTLYEYRNVTHAADHLYLTQPTVTKRLKLIEEEFGVTIAIRGKRGIQFTPEGEYLAVKASQITAILREIRDHLALSSQEEPSTLLVGASNSMARSSLPGLIQTHRLTHPHVQFEIITERSSQLTRLMEQGRLDLAFVNGEIPFSGEKLLFRREHAYLASTMPLKPEDLNQYPYLTYYKDPCTQSILEHWWQEYHSSPFPTGLKVQHGDICREMVLKGLGYSIFFVQDYMADYPQYQYTLYHRDGTPLLRNTWLIFTSHSFQKKQVREFVEKFM